MLHISYLLPKDLMNDDLSSIHAARKRAHHANNIILVFIYRLHPNSVKVHKPETIYLKKTTFVQAVQFAKVFELLAACE